MENFGFLKIAAAIPEVRVADCEFNGQQIEKLIFNAYTQGAKIICFPELSVTSYSCGDLFFQRKLIQSAEKTVAGLLKVTKNMPIGFIIGVPIEHNSKLYNCATLCFEGSIRGIVPKTYLPNYAEFYEKRWFQSYQPIRVSLPQTIRYADSDVLFGTNILFNIGCGKFAVEICEDLWSVIPPSSGHAMSGASLIFNLSASNELIGKQQYVKSLISQQSARCQAAYLYTSAGFGESTTDVVYTGNAYIYENGKLLAESKRFQLKEQLIISDIDVDLLNAERQKNTTFIAKPSVNCTNYAEERLIPINPSKGNFRLNRFINSTPFIPVTDNYNESCEEIFSIQVLGLAKRLVHTSAHSLILGVSGGLDSTLALLVCIKTADRLELSRKMIHGVTMPGFGTSKRTLQNACRLMETLGITPKNIDITAACQQHFKDIDHEITQHDITYENTQARERTQILMDLANQLGGLVVGTGDMSELALGWATYNGDHISMYGVNAGIPKTLVRHLVKWVTENQMNTETNTETQKTLRDIIETPVSPELLPVDSEGTMTQFTEDLIGSYELHDFFLFYTLRYGFSPAKIYFLAQHAFKNIYEKTVILKWMEVFYRRFFSQQFKRSCMPDGTKVGSVNLSPRGDWRMPSDAHAALWLEEIKQLKENPAENSPIF
ncbi:MAG: NAD(+) synthase [Planctomycetaceae bacterium]|jgi:NAD+ synthase (glutamine-hydrolysing)|nr:NAD(+) synthase [Planctomycetaceae bacterium]